LTVSHLRLTGVLQAEEPLSIGSGRRTGVIRHSLPYVPGFSIRGCVGTSLLRAACRLDKPLLDHSSCAHFSECEYAKLFESDESSSAVFFRYAYPLHIKCGGVYRPAPKTLYRCENSQCREVIDALEPPSRCPKCEGLIKAYPGYICDRCGELSDRPIKMTRVTSTALARDTWSAASVKVDESVKAGTLHTTEAIPAGSRFSFEVVLGSRHASEVDVLMSVVEKGVPDEGLGGSRSRGFGRVSVRELKLSEVTCDDVVKRGEAIDSSSFSVQALSPLLLDRPLDCTSLLEGARRAYSWVYHAGKPQLPDLKQIASRVSIARFGGWSQKDDRGRGPFDGFEAGSVFQFSSEGRSSELCMSLAALDVYPFGDYKPHGCGQVRVEGPR